MSKADIALQLTLAMIEKGYVVSSGERTNESVGKSVSEIYNAVIRNIETRVDTDR